MTPKPKSNWITIASVQLTLKIAFHLARYICALCADGKRNVGHIFAHRLSVLQYFVFRCTVLDNPLQRIGRRNIYGKCGAIL